MQAADWIVKYRGLLYVFLASVALAGVLPETRADPIPKPTPPTETPAPPPASPEAAARLVLEKNCAGCHQLGRSPAALPSPFANVLELDELSKTPGLISPSRPDASRLYTIMLTGHRLAAGLSPEALTELQPEEIALVRAWIDGLPPIAKDDEPCPGGPGVTLAETGRAIEKLQRHGGKTLKDIRFISLAGYRNACATAADMERHRLNLRRLLKVLSKTNRSIDMPRAADGLPVLAVRLTQLGWHTTQWDALAAMAAAPRLSSMRLAEAYGTDSPLIDVRALAAAAYQSKDFPRLMDLPPDTIDMIRDGLSNIVLHEAAADVGIAADRLRPALESVSGDWEGAAKTLLRGSLPATAWRRLRAHIPLLNEKGPMRYAGEAGGMPASGMDPMRIWLWTEKKTYATGDLLTINAQANRGCKLTIINVAPNGEATMLYPSDFSPDNALEAGQRVAIPDSNAEYQLRLDETGTETFIATCALHRSRLLGAGHNFDRQRFTVLGDWETFLKTASKREARVGRFETRKQRKAREQAEEEEAAAGPDEQVRTALEVKVEKEP